MDDVDHVDEGGADLENRMPETVTRGRTQAKAGCRLVAVLVDLHEPGSVERRDDAAGRVVGPITERFGNGRRRTDHRYAGDRRPQLVRPVLNHQAAGVVEVEMRDDHE